MPGLVADHVAAMEEVKNWAIEHHQRWDVVAAYLENLRDMRSAYPEETYSQAMAHALRHTKDEIREAREVDYLIPRSVDQIKLKTGADHDVLPELIERVRSEFATDPTQHIDNAYRSARLSLISDIRQGAEPPRQSIRLRLE